MISKMTSFANLVILRNIVIAKLWLCFIKLSSCFITGEVSEQIPAIAKENDIAFISAGHHATERYGIQALCQHLSDKLIDILS
jgi:hypothetical protein